MYYAGESLLELAVSLHEIELRMEFGNCARSKIHNSLLFRAWLYLFQQNCIFRPVVFTGALS